MRFYRIFDAELDFVTNLIYEDVRNNSAWNQRFFVLSNIPNLKQECLEMDMAFTWTQIELAMSNESPWNYMKGYVHTE